MTDAPPTLPADKTGHVTGPIGAIPKIIHQTYHSKHLPGPFQDAVDTAIRLNPNWEHRLYDDADIVNFIAQHYDERVMRCYTMINPKYGAARADLFRYLLLHKIGGIYIDIKAVCLKSFDDVLRSDDRFVLAQWQNTADGEHSGWGTWPELTDVAGGEYQQWHIIAAPGHPFLKAVIDRVLTNIETYRPWRDGVRRHGVVRLTGPIAYTRAIRPIIAQHPHRFAASATDVGLRYRAAPEHEQLFMHHYANIKESIVTMRGIAKPISYAYLCFVKTFNVRT